MHWPISSTLGTEPSRSVLHPEHLPALGHVQELQEATCGWQHEQLMFSHPCFPPFLLVGMKTTLLTLNRNTAQSSAFKSTHELFWPKLWWWWTCRWFSTLDSVAGGAAGLPEPLVQTHRWAPQAAKPSGLVGKATQGHDISSALGQAKGTAVPGLPIETIARPLT